MNERLARKTIADHLGVPELLVLDSVAFRDLGADSLDLVELTLALEQAFDIGIPDDEAYSCLTVGDAIAVLRAADKRRVAEQALPAEQCSSGQGALQ